MSEDDDEKVASDALRLIEDLAEEVRPIAGGYQERARDLLRRYDAIHPECVPECQPKKHEPCHG